jgi:hypothetical protein
MAAMALNKKISTLGQLVEELTAIVSESLGLRLRQQGKAERKFSCSF